MKTKNIRTLIGVTASLLTASMLVPSAFAGTQTIQKEFRASISVNGKVQSNPTAIRAMDGNTLTTYMPVWYIDRALRAAGYSVVWDGTSHSLNIQSTVPWPQSANASVGRGNAQIQINNSTVKKMNDIVIKDPTGGTNAKETAYLPIYYIDWVLKQVYGQTTWNGSNWNIAPWGGGTQLHGTQPETLGVQSMHLGTQDQLYVTATKGGTITIPWSEVKLTIQGPSQASVGPNGNFMASSPGQYTVRESFGPTSSSLKIDVYAAPAGVDVQPNFPALIANGTDTNTITVKVVDYLGDIVSDFNGQVQLSVPTDGGTLSHKGIVDIHNGMGTILLTAPGAVPSQNQIITSSNLMSSAGDSLKNIQYGVGAVQYVKVLP